MLPPIYVMPMLFLGYKPIPDATFQELPNPNGHDSCFQLYGYKRNIKRSILFHLISILFCFIPYVIIFWLPRHYVIKYKGCALNVAQYAFGKQMQIVYYGCKANFFVVSDSHGYNKIVEVKTEQLHLQHLGGVRILRYFVLQHTKYVYAEERDAFLPIDQFFPALMLNDLLEDSNGLRPSEQFNL